MCVYICILLILHKHLDLEPPLMPCAPFQYGVWVYEREGQDLRGLVEGLLCSTPHISFILLNSLSAWNETPSTSCVFHPKFSRLMSAVLTVSNLNLQTHPSRESLPLEEFLSAQSLTFNCFLLQKTREHWGSRSINNISGQKRMILSFPVTTSPMALPGWRAAWKCNMEKGH